MKKRINILPIYSVPFIFLLFLLFGSLNSVVGVFAAIIVSCFAAVILGAVFSSIDEKTEEVTCYSDESSILDELDNQETPIRVLCEKQISVLQGTAVAEILRRILENIANTEEAIKNRPEKAENRDYIRFEKIYRDYSKELVDYENCLKINNFGKGITRFLTSVEEQFEILEKISAGILEELYSSDLIRVKANTEAIHMLFSTLEDDGLHEEVKGGDFI